MFSLSVMFNQHTLVLVTSYFMQHFLQNVNKPNNEVLLLIQICLAIVNYLLLLIFEIINSVNSTGTIFANFGIIAHWLIAKQ